MMWNEVELNANKKGMKRVYEQHRKKNQEKLKDMYVYSKAKHFRFR